MRLVLSWLHSGAVKKKHALVLAWEVHHRRSSTKSGSRLTILYTPLKLLKAPQFIGTQSVNTPSYFGLALRQCEEDGICYDSLELVPDSRVGHQLTLHTGALASGSHSTQGLQGEVTLDF
jgi:hypothetical protein